ncbi:amidohydrolase family protein [Microtetraspora malaysiensis]|uniref:amidohydrolase family protein n=1 Tax=Microtetraspora malaysiensis TaxID=161358 RepID=UPI003D8FAF08
MLATAPGGHPSQLMAGFDASTLEAFGDAVGGFDTVADPGQAKRFVEARLTEGIDYLKIVVDDGAVHGARLPALTRQIVAALVEAAHANGLTTIGHAITGQAEAADHALPGCADNAVHAARTLHQAGVSLLAGTDANPFAPVHGAAMHRELALLTEAGLSNVEALTAATSVPARHFGLADRGHVAPGLRADLLLVDGDPTRDITATAAIAEVWRRGVRQSR